MSDATSLARELDILERIHRDIGSIITRSDDARRIELVRRRRELSAQIATLGRVGEPLFTDPADQAEFRRLFSAVLSAVAKHQAEWPAVRLGQDHAQYLRSGGIARTATATFTDWLRDRLSLGSARY